MTDGRVVDLFGLPRAALLQVDVTMRDLTLRDVARLLRYAVRWWWGVRRQGPASDGAECYLCGAIIATWSSRYPMTQDAIARVLDHRDVDHVDDRVTGTMAGGKSPSAGAPEARRP